MTESLSQVRFRAADGHREVLWTQQEGGHYRVLNVPVWLYGILRWNTRHRDGR